MDVVIAVDEVRFVDQAVLQGDGGFHPFDDEFAQGPAQSHQAFVA